MRALALLVVVLLGSARGDHVFRVETELHEVLRVSTRGVMTDDARWLLPQFPVMITYADVYYAMWLASGTKGSFCGIQIGDACAYLEHRR